MSKVLTSEDKVYLGRVCRYLGSIGMNEGTIEFEDVQGDASSDSFNWNYISHFSNNYQAEIPEGLKDILKKILDYIDSKNMVDFKDIESFDWERIEIKIDCEIGEISAAYDIGYTEPGDEEGTEWDLENDEEEILPLFESIVEIEPSDTELVLLYNGGGDSGFIESNFDNGDSVPPAIEDWCYSELESLHGGWEINEGSQGKFFFDLNNNTIRLEHQFNRQESEYDTVWEENF
jgi:hypothetical protein